MGAKVVRILSLAALLATCVENKEKTQIKLKQLSPYLQPPPLAKTPSNSATTKLGAVKLRLSSVGKVKSQISVEDSSVQRVPRWNFGKEATTDTFSVPKDGKNHGSSRPSGTRTKLFPLNSSQRQETAGSSKRQRAILQYPPNQQFLSQSSHSHKSSKDCNPCNKVPWIPLLEHHASEIDTSVSDSVGHYSHHRDLPITPLGIPSSLIGPGRFKESSLNFPDNSDRLKFNKPKDGVTYLPPALQTPIPWQQSSSYVTPYSSSIPKKVYTRLVHPERTPTGPPNQNVPQYNNPGPMYRYLVPPPIASQFPGENKYLPSLSSSLTSSKTETFYGLPFFIPQRSNTTRQHEKIVEPTSSPLSVQQAIPFTSPQGLPHYVNVNAKLQPEQIYFKNRSAHSLSTQFYEPSNFFPVPPLHEAHTFSHGDHNVSLPENLVPPGISVGNVAFSAEQQENVHQHQISHSSHGTDNDLKLLNVRGSVFDVVPSIPVSEEFEVTHFNENLSQTTITEPSFSGLHPSEDQVISPSQNNQNSNTNFFNTQEQYNTPVGSQYHSNTPSQTDSNLEVIKSVQVANYISSIEYPLQFVHSPYIDINTTSSIESLRNTSFHETKELHQTPQPENASHINFNPDTSDIIVGKPITLESSAYDIFNTTSGEYQNSIPNFEQQKFENSDNYNIHQNYSSFDASDYNLRQNLSSYLSENSNEFSGGSEDYSFVWNNTSKDFHHNFKSHINNSEEANIRLTAENNNVWYNSQYEATTQKYTDTLKEESHTVTSQQAAYFNPLSTASPQQKVTVYIQPSIQTTALHDASLVRQINNLDQQHHPAFAHDQTLSSYHHESPHSVIKNPKGAFTIQQQVPPPAPFRNMFSDIENMFPPPFNYIGVIKRPLHLQTNSASVHNPFINNLPQNFFNTAQNEGHFFNQRPQPGQDEYVKWTTSPGSTSAPIPTRQPIVPAWQKPTTSMPPQDSVHGQSIHTINSAGLLPPPMPHHIRTNVPTKNTKQIQIIVPYTSGKDSLPFLPQRGRPLDIETTGWHPMTGSKKGESVAKNCSNSNIRQISECNTGKNLNQWWQQQEDYHQHQESRTVTATASATSNPFQATLTNLNSLIREGSNKQKPFTVTQQHILASNIQDLLRGEQENITIPDSIDLKQLQKYIDDWTASEYSSFNASVNTSKANEVQSGVTPESHNSIVSHQLIPSKKIPAEYLTTPPSIFDDFMSAENSIATAVPRLAGKNNNFVTQTPRSINNSLVSLSSKVQYISKPKEANISNQQSIFFKNSLFWDSIINKDNVHTATTSPAAITETTTDATTYDTTTVTEVTSSPSWEDLQVSISPITKEKVYVVTPLSSWPPEPSSTPWPSSNSHRGILSNTPKTTKTGAWDRFPSRNPENTIDSFHSPRFSIRPTPGTTMQRSFTVTNDEESEDSNATTFYPAENEISYTYNSRENADGERPRGGPSTRRAADAVLWGLSELPTYTPAGARVRTYSGHSRVVTMSQVVTTPTAATPAGDAPPRRPVGVLSEYRPDRHSYLWHFPELLAPSAGEDEAAAVRDAAVELQKERKQR